VDTIRDRLAANVDDDAIYLLADPTLRPVAGNLERWPAMVTGDVEWSEIPIDRAGVRGLARIRHFVLPGGYNLLVGRDVQARAQLRRILGDALIWTPSIVVALGVAGALAVRSLFRITINDVAATAAAFSRGDLTRRVRGLKAGGDDYMTKPFAFSELLARVEALTRRGKTEAPLTKLTASDLEMDLLSRTVRRSGQKIDLQPREFRLLEYLLRHAGQVVTRTMLLEGVWDYHFDPQTNVIDVHVSRLRQKVDKPFPTPLIHTVRNAGYMLRAD